MRIELKRKKTLYYIFDTEDPWEKPVCTCRTLKRARNVMKAISGTRIEKSWRTPSRLYFGTWIPKKERNSILTVSRHMFSARKPIIPKVVMKNENVE